MVRKGRLLEIITSTREGSRVRVKARISEKKTTVSASGFKSRDWMPIAIVENTGGFKYQKDFDYGIAEQLACENCIGMVQDIE